MAATDECGATVIVVSPSPIAPPGDRRAGDPDGTALHPNPAAAGAAESAAEERAVERDLTSQGSSTAALLLRAALVVVLSVTVFLGGQLTMVSGLQHRAAQSQSFAALRLALARGTAPIAAVDSGNELLPLGTPVALIEIPAIGVREVVGEGTSAGVLMRGPGHRRDTPMPGQAGTSEIYGRRAAYGGPFRNLSQLRPGDEITVTTGQGVSRFEVSRFRAAGDPRPASPPQDARLTLATAAGPVFRPTGVLWVDAELARGSATGPGRPLRIGSIPGMERPMASDPSTLWALVFWLQALVLVAVGGVWSWTRWGRHQTWIVFAPVTAAVGLATAGQVARLLPNLL